jgi:hypothetical protein
MHSSEQCVAAHQLEVPTQLFDAATQVDPSDLRPTGPPQPGRAARILQQQLDERLAAPDTSANELWRRLLATEVPGTTADSFLPELQERLTNLTRAGFDATRFCGRPPPPGRYPTTTPPQPSGGASSTSYRKRRTKITQTLRRSRRPAA